MKRWDNGDDVDSLCVVVDVIVVLIDVFWRIFE